MSSDVHTIIHFPKPESTADWQTVDDVVMGGRSHSALEWVDHRPADSRPGSLRFHGVVSLENNGGFCSAKNCGHWRLSGVDHLIFELYGDGHDYDITIRTPDIADGASFRHPIETRAGRWQRLELAIDDFRLWRRGQLLSKTRRLDPSDIVSFGFLIAGGQQGEFRLDLHRVATRDAGG